VKSSQSNPLFGIWPERKEEFMDIKEKEKRIDEAKEILNWAIMHLNGSIQCKVIDYKYENYRVQFLTKENELIMPVQISEEWIKDSNPRENFIHDKLKILLINLEKEAKRERR
jgi:hypothetical protein